VRSTAREKERFRKLGLTLAEVETGDVREHTFLAVRGKKFAWHLVDHHGDGRISMQCKAERGENAELVASEPDRFFMPPYMARHGWVGLWLDVGKIDWEEIRELVTDAYRLTAPKRLVALLDAEA
jgi:hypothetical protein